MQKLIYLPSPVCQVPSAQSDPYVGSIGPNYHMGFQSGIDAFHRVCDKLNLES